MPLSFIKIFGGKYYQWKNIVAAFPNGFQDLTYVEPFVGGGAVILNKPRSQREVINDIDSNLITLYLEVRDNCKEFLKELRSLKYEEATYEKARSSEFHPAVNEFVLRRMSRGGAKQTFGWSERLRRKMPEYISGWIGALKNLPAVSKRLQGVEIRNEDYRGLLEEFAGPDTFFYLDPPYVVEERVSTNVYEFEFSMDDHVSLLNHMKTNESFFLLSGYGCPTYAATLNGWVVSTKEYACSASAQKKKPKRIESLWRNYEIITDEAWAAARSDGKKLDQALVGRGETRRKLLEQMNLAGETSP